METIIINESNLSNEDIQIFNNKVRAVLLKDNMILVSNYNGVVLLPGGAINADETDEEALIRELKEETGIIYDFNSMKELLNIENYQKDYPTRRDETVNRLIKTKYYLGEYKGIDLENVNRTENEVKGNFYSELKTLDEFIDTLKELSDNPRKKYFDRENEEIIKVLSR